MIRNSGLGFARRLGAGLALAVLASTLVACGGGSGGGSATANPSPTTPGPPPTTTPPPPANRPPVISGTPATALAEGATYSFQPVASDPDGDPLAFSAAGLPSWLTLDGASGRLNGTAPQGSAGTYSGIVISVSDGRASASLAPFAITVTRPAASGKAELIWTAPTRNEDGSALTDLAGYRIRYGQSVGALTRVAEVASPATTTVTIEGLSGGTWYFTVSSYTHTGAESAPTGAVSKTIG